MMATVTYRASPIKRARRSKASIESLRGALYDIIAEQRPMTVRQIFYQATTRGLVDKTEAEYKGTVCRLLASMRRDGELPYDWIADNTRWMRKPRTYSGLEAMLDNTAKTYRRALWDTQNAYVEIWLEKEALAGVLLEVINEWDVPLMVTRGYPSMSFLHSAAESIRDQDRPTYLYYFGDYDPSGMDISRHVEKEIRELATDARIEFKRLAVNYHQIASMDLPTRPTKKSDSRSKGFGDESVEVDAIPPATLREMARTAVIRHIDDEALQRLLVVEEAERYTLKTIAAKYNGEAAGE